MKHIKVVTSHFHTNLKCYTSQNQEKAKKKALVIQLEAKNKQMYDSKNY